MHIAFYTLHTLKGFFFVIGILLTFIEGVSAFKMIPD